MKFIETLREGERISEIYLCKHKQTALTKAGKPYDSLILQDKTGTLDAKIWDVGSAGIEEFDSLDYVYVMVGWGLAPAEKVCMNPIGRMISAPTI